MANINNTFLTSDADPTTFDGMVSRLKIERERERYSEKPGELFIRTGGGTADKEISELSKQYPEVTFKARYSFAHERFSKIFHIEYKGGVDTEKDVVPNYWWPGDTTRYPHFDILSEKAIEIFRRIDTAKEDKSKGIDWYKKEVTLVVSHGEYKMVCTKIGYDIDNVQMFKSHVEKIRWAPITGRKVAPETDPLF